MNVSIKYDAFCSMQESARPETCLVLATNGAAVSTLQSIEVVDSEKLLTDSNTTVYGHGRFRKTGFTDSLHRCQQCVQTNSYSAFLICIGGTSSGSSLLLELLSDPDDDVSSPEDELSCLGSVGLLSSSSADLLLAVTSSAWQEHCCETCSGEASAD